MLATPRSRSAAVAALFTATALLAAACFPQEQGARTEVSGAQEALPEPPVFPETGQVPPDLLIDGLVYDFTTAPVDLDLWVPPTAEARCAAERIVENHGERLSDLGYEPGRSGAGLNDIALNDAERESVSQLFQSCVDLVQAVAALLTGSGHMTSRQALCMSRGINDQGMGGQFVDAWLAGTVTDPLADEGALAANLLANTDVCLPDTAFTWNGVDLPGDEDVVGVDEGQQGEPGADLPGSAGKITTTTEGRPTGGAAVGGP